MSLRKTITWLPAEEAMYCEDMDVLTCDKAGNICIGSIDEHGWTDQHCSPLYDIVFFAVLPKAPASCIKEKKKILKEREKEFKKRAAIVEKHLDEICDPTIVTYDENYSPNGIITNDKWVDLVAKKGLLK